MGVQQQVPPSGESSSMNSPLHVSKVVGRMMVMAILISPFPRLEDGNREMEKEGDSALPLPHRIWGERLIRRPSNGVADLATTD